MDLDPAEDGVTAWLHDGRNTLTVVLIGTPSDVPFRMRVARDGQSGWTLDEADFLPLDTSWRLKTLSIGRVPDALPTRSGARPSDALALGKSLRTDLIAASPMLGPPAIPD